jgi:hypothetical protein
MKILQKCTRFLKSVWISLSLSTVGVLYSCTDRRKISSSGCLNTHTVLYLVKNHLDEFGKFSQLRP